jgi:AraC-like DNA-binding protein
MELGISKEWLIKYFRKSFGVTPIYYRNEKRMMEALFLLHVEKNKIVNLSQEIGFNDLKHFNQLFKKAISVPPYKFLDKEL